MRTTTVVYTCDRCKISSAEEEKGFYPIGWQRITITDIRSNIEIVKNSEFCMQCAKELQTFIFPILEETNAKA